MWLFLGFVSALFLGFYDVFKKTSLQGNAVIPVLFSSIVISSAYLLPFYLLSLSVPSFSTSVFYVPGIDFRTHLLLILKALIVLTSWLFAYFAIKHLPITIASPIKATQPVWVVVGGLLIFNEKLSFYQSIGVGITLFSFLLLSVAGKKDGFSIRNNKWIWFIILATFTGALSGLYDKFLLKHIHPMSVLVFYTFYQAIIMGAITLLLWFPTRKTTTHFQFRWSIGFISLFLMMADFTYFYALSLPDSMISIIGTVRRSGVIVPFLYGALVMKDKNLKLKVIDLIGLVIGMVFLYLGS
ncbi:MAG: EamA family transporter [Porphyromonadaceae bacterium CG2_30_38_12]|nr:MAG: EamA family transporter [Porphyromonadaceae bacterium CG2_30_38_12]